VAFHFVPAIGISRDGRNSISCEAVEFFAGFPLSSMFLDAISNSWNRPCQPDLNFLLQMSQGRKEMQY
jgi:hypothetical protein